MAWWSYQGLVKRSRAEPEDLWCLLPLLLLLPPLLLVGDTDERPNRGLRFDPNTFPPFMIQHRNLSEHMYGSLLSVHTHDSFVDADKGHTTAPLLYQPDSSRSVQLHPHDSDALSVCSSSLSSFQTRYCSNTCNKMKKIKSHEVK